MRRWPVLVVAADISRAMLDRVPQRPDIETRLLDGRNLGDIGRIHAAYSVAMLQHIPHDAQESYIGQVAEMLPSGGRFAFTTAVGLDDQFLNHQVDVMQVTKWMRPLQAPLYAFADGRGWSWFVGAKP